MLFSKLLKMPFVSNGLKKMLQSKLKGVPQAEQEKILIIMEKDPELMMKIAKEVQDKMAQGKDQMTASMEVMQAHESELRKLIS